MCDKAHFDALEERVDDLEKDMAVIKSTQDSMRAEMKQGFTDVKLQLQAFWGERKEWGEFARESLRNIGKWIAKWGTIILFASLGVAWSINVAKQFFVK